MGLISVFCTVCGAENPEHAKFCANCGRLIDNPSVRSSKSPVSETLLCPFCYKEISREALKCKYCGEWVNKEKKRKKKIIKLTKTALISETISEIIKSIKGALAAVKIAPAHLALIGISALAVTTIIAGSILASPGETNNTTQIDNQQTQVNKSPQSSIPQSSIISASKAKSIASHYLTSRNQKGGSQLDAGTPSLKADIYYVPMVVTNSPPEGQYNKGTVVGNVKVDAKTGKVLGTQTWDIVTGI